MATSQPSITRVIDSQDIEVPSGTSTVDTNLTLSGEAEPHSIIYLYDQAAQLMPVSVTSSGHWTLPLTGLALGSHRFTAQTLDGSLTSAAWTITVTMPAVKPRITRVTGAHGDVTAGGSTQDTTLTFSGSSGASAQVKIFDGSTVKNEALAASGQWRAELNRLSVGAHVFTAQSDGLTSDSWPLTIQEAVPPLLIDQTPLVLGGLVRLLGTPSSPPSGSYGQRWPSSGVPPYTFSNPDGRVDAQNNGLIISRRNGAGTVTVTDSAGQTTTFPVQVSGVLELDGWAGYDIYRVCSANVAASGGRLPTIEEWHALRGAYGNAPVFSESDKPAWSSSSAGGIQKHCIVPTSGAASTQPDQGFIIGGRGAATGWVLYTNR